MVCMFLAFSSCRSLVASAMAASKAATAFVSSSMSSANFAIDACSSSISACKVSTASVFSFRVCSLVDSSVSHQPLCSASSFASSMRRTMRSLIIFFTFRNGSSETRTAKAESTRLPNCLPRLLRYCATRAWFWLYVSARSMASAEPSPPDNCCAKAGKCVSAWPLTEELEMISMALLMASISSARSCCRDSKSVAFCSQVAVKSSRYFWSASRVVVVSSKSPVASALACRVLAFNSAFSSLSWVACSICAVRSCISMSYACFEFISVFSRSVRSAMNLSNNFSNISITPCDWNS
mmetsp:Transcript_139362/g.353417  ORF Transcript_139362/g.353417 Transcript_139362/m.353417 type:complete len:295 (+) Transcript_139362:693-1577(+)